MPPDQPTKLDKIVAYALIGLLTILEAIGLIATGGYPPVSVWFLMLLGSVILVGLTFYLLVRGATGEVAWKVLGVKLGGPAAVGLGIVLVLHNVLDGDPSERVIRLEQAHCGPMLQMNASSVDLGALLIEGPAVYITFNEGKNRGWFETRHLSDDGLGWILTRYSISRVGVPELSTRREDP